MKKPASFHEVDSFCDPLRITEPKKKAHSKHSVKRVRMSPEESGQGVKGRK